MSSMFINQRKYFSPAMEVHPQTKNDNTHNGCPRLLEVHKDRSQLVQLTKPQDGPIGLYIAKGNAKFRHGKLRTNRLIHSQGQCQV